MELLQSIELVIYSLVSVVANALNNALIDRTHAKSLSSMSLRCTYLQREKKMFVECKMHIVQALPIVMHNFSVYTRAVCVSTDLCVQDFPWLKDIFFSIILSSNSVANCNLKKDVLVCEHLVELMYWRLFPLKSE